MHLFFKVLEGRSPRSRCPGLRGGVGSGAQGVSGPWSSCVWNPRVFADDARGSLRRAGNRASRPGHRALARSSLLGDWFPSAGAVLSLAQTHRGRPQTMFGSQSCPTLCDPVDYSPPGSSVHGILQARILEWVAMPSSIWSSFVPLSIKYPFQTQQ